VRGDLHKVLTAGGISDALDFAFFPFGNAFFANNDNLGCSPLTCKVDGFFSYYNESNPNPDYWTGCEPSSDDDAGRPSARLCWQEKCGVGGGANFEACTTGDAVYQHGPGEGLADVVEACAMASVGDPSDFALWFPFVYCFEGVALNDALSYPSYSYGTPKNQTLFRKAFQPGNAERVEGQSFGAAINLTMATAQECALSTGLNFTYISACASPSVGASGQLSLGPEGAALEAANAWATAQLQPPHTYTPWVLLEGRPIVVSDDDDSGYSDLLSWVCAEFKQKNKQVKHLAIPVGCPPDPQSIPSALVGR